MGLRFRKSISLGKGIRLNVGKTGVSISAGIPGFRKTIHSSGRVTTTVGIPGSGLYYVDTDHIGSKKKRQSQNQGYSLPEQQSAPIRPNASSKQAPTSSSASFGDRSARSKQTNIEQSPVYYPVYTPAVDSPATIVDQEIPAIPEQPHRPSFRDLFENCDLPINWIEVLSNREPVDDSYDANTWSYLHSKAISVFEGDVEVMLQIVDEVSPFDDMARYASDFSVEMENPTELGIEFTVAKDVAPRGELQDAVCSILIRTARDAFALLPVERVTIHTMLDGDTIIAAKLNREAFASLEFEGKDPSDLLESFEVNMKFSPILGFRKVDRFI